MYEGWSASDIRNKIKYEQAIKNYNAEVEKQNALELQKQAEQESSKANANFFERAWQTTVDFVGQVGVGVSKGLEGIIDFGSGIVGGIGGLFDKDFQEQVKKNIAYDWTYNNIQQPLADATQKSYINDASQGVQNVIRGVPNALGQIAPALLTGPAALPTLMISSAGNGMEEAFADGADYYKGLLYGSVTGAVEGAIEKLSGGIAKGVFGKGLADNIFEKIAGNAYASKGVKYLLDAGGEALEEYVSTSINPYIKRMTYDPNAELSTQQERLESALIGGLASMGYRSTIGKVGEKKTDVLENVQTIQETQQQANQEWGKGKLTDARYEKYNNRIERAYQTASARLKEMKSDKRQKFMQKYGLDKMFDLDGNIIGRPTQNVGQNQTVSSGVINSSSNANFAQNGTEINAEKGVNTQINGQAIQNAQFSIKKDADGNEYVNIDTDQHLFDGKNAEEMRDIASTVIRDRFQGQTISGAIINARSRNEYNNSEYTKKIKRYDASIYESKMRLATELDNFLKTAKFLRHENAKHPKPFNKDGYDIYQVDFELNGNKFSGELLVAINENERKFYDIVKIKNRTTPLSFNKSKADTVQLRTVDGSNPIDNSIRNNSEKVNINSQKNEKNLKNNANNAKNQAKSSQNTAPKASLTKQDSAKNTTASAGKPNRDAYSPMLWNKEDSLLYKPTSKELTAEQKETLKYFTQMNSYRNFALVCITDELPANENGVYKDGIIYVSRTSKDPMQVTLMHEMTHYLEKSKAYDEYAKYILSDLSKEKSVLKHINDVTGNNWTVQEIIDRYSKVYNNVEDIKSEIIAIYTSEYMFTDLYAMARMGVKKKGLLQKIHNFAWSVGEYFKNKSNKTKQEHSVNKFLQNAQKLYKNALNNATAIVNQNTLSANDDKEYKVIEQAKYSVADADADLQNTDNKGNVLSKEQKEFFKNSKVIDSKGQLKVCYHGSGATFNVFNYDKLGANGTAEGKGFYFTDSKEYSQAYKTDNEESKVYETYINIEKPLNTQKITISRSEIKKLIKGIDPDGYDYLSNYGDVEFEGYNAVLNQAVDSEFSYNDNDVDLIHSILNSSKYQDELEIFYDKLREILGYDGIIQDWGENTKRREDVGIWYIVFNANQIKEITNKTPTKSDDIRYSLTKDVDKNAQNDVNYVQVLTHNELWKKLSKQEQAIFYRKIDEIHHQDYFAYTLENGDVVLDVENKIIISNGEFDKPSIECIIEFNSDTGKISEARDYFYEIYNGRTIWQWVKIINNMCKEEVAILYSRKNSEYDSQFARQDETDSGLDGISELNGRRAEIPSGTSEDGTKYSITKGEYNKAMANYRREKVYSRKESAKIIEEIVSKELNINADYYGIITAKDKDKAITKLFEDLNGVKPSELQVELNKIADIIITESKYRNIYEDLEQVDLTGYDAIKSYMQKLNITSLKEEIKHRYDTDGARAINLLWSAGENKGVSVEDAIEELREQGVYIEANNDVDAFFELLDTYDNLKSQVNAKIEEYKSDDFTADELNDLRKRIVSGLEKEIANAGKTSKIANMKAYYNAQVERMRADRKTAYLYSRSLVRLKTAYDRLKNLKNTPANEMLLPIVEEIVKAMQKTMTYTGNLNKNMRTILRDEFSPIHKKLVELSEDNDNPYLQVLSEIANKPSNENITPEEMSLLAQVFENTIHLIKNYDRAFWQGKVQKESELAERAVSETNFAKDYISNNVIYNKIFLSYANPQDVFNSLTCEGEDGFMAQAFQEIISSEIEKQTILSKVDYRLKEIEQKHKKEMKTWDKQDIDFKGKQISRGQQITLVMMWEREQARQHLENGGSVVLNEKYMGKEDYKRAVYEPTLKAVITQEDIDSLKGTLTEAQKDYIKFAEYVFNDVCKNAKYETDIALRGVSNIESGKYIPIEVADDEIAKRIGSEYSEDATINKRMQSVYSYSANKATKVGAKNAVVIDDIRRVLRRHTEDMATYAGYGKCINSLNRIMNRKTADGRTLKTALNEANTNIVPYIQKLLKDVQGINKGRDNVQKFLDVVRNYSYKATLGLNLKSWAMQTLSLFSARGGGLKYGNLAEGFAKFIAHPKFALKELEELDRTNALAHARFRDGFNSDVGRAMSEIGYLGKFDKVTDKLMAPMQKIDQWMCGAIWEACKIQTKNDLQKANDLFTKVLIKTQANWTPAFRPQILRSDNALVKFFTIYMSEPLQLFSRLSSSVLELKKLTKMKKSDRYRSDTEFAKRVDGQLKEARDNFITQTTNVLGSMTLSTLIAVAFKELLKTTGDDDDEEFIDRLLPEFGANVFGMLPIMRNIYSILQGYDITNSAYTGLTNIVNAGKNMWDLSEMLISGRQYTSVEIASIIRQTANGLAQTFGIPLRNAEKYAKAFIDLVSPETAYKWNSAFKSRSTSAYYTALEKASGNESLQAVITQTLLRDKGVAVGSESVRDEMLRLFNMGINALPRSVATSVTYNDEKIELTQSQYKQVQNAYNKASEQADKLLATKEYANASDEVKGTALKKLYDYYYDLAMQEITKSDYSKFGLFAQGMDAYKLAIYSAQINEIKKQYQNTSNSALKNASTNTLKNQIINYVNKLSLNATQKYMLLGYCGYKNTNGANQVKAYINRLNLTKEQKEKLYTYSGYTS